MGCINNKESIELSEKLTNPIINNPSKNFLPELPPRPIDLVSNHIRIRVNIDDTNDFVVIDHEQESKIENLEIKDNHCS